MGEFTGVFRKNTLPAKDKGAPLSSSERLRLIYLTGQEDDVTVAPDRLNWLGIDPAEQAKRDADRARTEANKLKIRRRANSNGR